MAKRREIGAGNVGCVVSLAILVVAVLIAMKIVPTRVAVAELQDFCERAAEQASLPRHTDAIITDEILIKAQQENLPVAQGRHQGLARRQHGAHRGEVQGGP